MFTFPEKEHLTEERRLPQTNAKVKTHQKKRIRNYKSSPSDLFIWKKKKCEEKQRSLLRVAWEINRRRSKQLSERLKLCKEKKKKKELIFKVSKILLRRKMNQGCLPGLLSLKGCKISGLVLPQDYRSRTKWYGVNSLWRLRERSSRMIFELLT